MVWQDNATSEMWLSVEHILWVATHPSGGSVIALAGDSRVSVEEHPHTIIRMIVNSIPADDEDADETYAQ